MRNKELKIPSKGRGSKRDSEKNVRHRRTWGGGKEGMREIRKWEARKENRGSGEKKGPEGGQAAKPFPGDSNGEKGLKTARLGGGIGGVRCSGISYGRLGMEAHRIGGCGRVKEGGKREVTVPRSKFIFSGLRG